MRSHLHPTSNLNSARLGSLTHRVAAACCHRSQAAEHWDRVSDVCVLCALEPGGKPDGANPGRERDRRSRRKCNRYHIADRPYWCWMLRQECVPVFARVTSGMLSSAIRMEFRRNVLVNTALAVCQVLLLVPLMRGNSTATSSLILSGIGATATTKPMSLAIRSL